MYGFLIHHHLVVDQVVGNGVIKMNKELFRFVDKKIDSISLVGYNHDSPRLVGL